jgi:hypothetical protein
MLKATWRRLGSPAWLAAGLVMLIPTLAQAQLFPNRTIRRERPPCSSEPPFNAQVRRDYFGYYPTCWTRFPSGWQCPCPNPELPNLDASIRKDGQFGQQTRKPLLEGEPGAGMGEPNPDDPGDRKPPGDNPNIPLPNDGRSPFEMDPSPRNPKPPGGAPGGDPFTDPNPPNPRPTAPNPAGRPSTSAGVLEMPQLPATTPSASFETPLQPGSMTMAPDATLASRDSADTRPDLGPLPAAPISVPNDLVSPSAPMGQPLPSPTVPAQAPRRQGILSKIFGSKNTTSR